MAVFVLIKNYTIRLIRCVARGAEGRPVPAEGGPETGALPLPLPELHKVNFAAVCIEVRPKFRG